MAYASPSMVASGTSFTQLLTYGFTGQLEHLLAAQVATSDPITAATITSSGGGSFGGSLAPGGYYVNFTETNAFGETKPSVESAVFTVAVVSAPTVTATVSVGSATVGALGAGGYFVEYTWIDSTTGGESTVGLSQSALFTCAAGNTPTVTIPAFPSYSTAANIYLSSVNATAASGNESLYLAGVTAVTSLLSSATWAGGATQAAAPLPPATNGLSVNIPRVLFPAVQTNNLAHNLYATSAGGATGTEVLYIRGITANTTNMSTAATTGTFAQVLPTANNTAPSTAQIDNIRAVELNQFDRVYRMVRQAAYNFLHGDPVPQPLAIRKLLDFQMAVLAMNTVCNEMLTLIDANPGHLVGTTNGIGSSTKKRTWP